MSSHPLICSTATRPLTCSPHRLFCSSSPVQMATLSCDRMSSGFYPLCFLRRVLDVIDFYETQIAKVQDDMSRSDEKDMDRR